MQLTILFVMGGTLPVHLSNRSRKQGVKRLFACGFILLARFLHLSN
jgi:hypothetical protein